jgi:hypothetical protein
MGSSYWNIHKLYDRENRADSVLKVIPVSTVEVIEDEESAAGQVLSQPGDVLFRGVPESGCWIQAKGYWKIRSSVSARCRVSSAASMRVYRRKLGRKCASASGIVHGPHRVDGAM